MDAAKLLETLEPLTHRARTKRIIELARDAEGGDADASRLLSELAAHAEPYARLLALSACFITRDAARVEAALRDRSRLVRSRATRLAALVLDDAQAAAAIAATHAPRARKSLVRGLWGAGRSRAIDRFLLGAAGDDPRAVDLLGYGSPSFVAQHFPRVREKLGPDGWARLAKHAPGVARDALLELLAPGAPDPRLRWRIAAVAPLLARSDTDAGLAIFERLLALGETPGAVRQLARALLPRRPEQVFDALRRVHEAGRPTNPPGAFGIVKLDAVAHRLGFERLAYAIEHAWETLSDGRRALRWFLRLDPSVRTQLVEHWLDRGRSAWGAFLLRQVPNTGDRDQRERRKRAYARWSAAAQDTHGVIRLDKIAELPPDLRALEARRHLERVEWLKDRPAERIAYARFLSADEAQPVIAPFLGHPEGEERAKALRTMIAAVEYDRPRLPAALAAIRARKFEQDPVRLAMIDSLASLRTACFSKEHLEEVGRIVKDGLDAADLSQGTAFAIERLVVRLFRLDAAWGSGQLTALLKTRGTVTAPGLGEGLSPRDARALAGPLGDLARSWSTKERAGAVVWLASSLGVRLSDVPGVLDALESLARELPFVHVAGVALALIRRHDAKRFARLVPELVKSDPSFAILSDVSRHLSLVRQDLLAPFLGGQKITGRFATGRTHWVLDFDGGTERWTTKQQTAYAAALESLLIEDQRDVPTLRFAIERLTRLAFAPSRAAIEHAADPRPTVREMATRGLAWIDGPEALPALIECLGDDRSRWAIYALRKVLAEMPRGEVIERLRAVPMTKVTVAKEVVRLMGELGGDEAYAGLIDLDRGSLHRDVRIALMRALWDHIGRDETWRIFDRAARGDDWVVASRLTDIPLGRLNAEQEERVIDLLSLVLGRKEPEARAALLAKATGLPLADRRRRWFGALVRHIGAAANGAEATLAARAALYRMEPGEVDALTGAMRALLPRRRTFLAVLPVFEPGAYSPKHHHAIATGILDLLAADPIAVADRIRFAGAALKAAELAKLLGSIAQAGLLFYDAMRAAEEAIERSVSPDAIERLLRDSADPALRRLAVSALGSAARPKEGWTEDRRERLARYRADPSIMVSAAAHHLFPPGE